MKHSVYSCLLVLAIGLIIITSFIPVTQAYSEASPDQAVNYGITRSKNGQLVPVFENKDSKNKTDLLNPDEICILESVSLVSKHYWYHVIYLDDEGNTHTGYLKESNFEQLSVDSLAEQMTDPQKAEKIAQYIALSEESPWMLLRQSGITNEPRMHYVLNTNSKKFHDPECRNAEQIKPKNRKDFTGTRQEVIDMGYDPCKNCNP